MVSIIVSPAVYADINDKTFLTELPTTTTGACLWFVETSPPRRPGLSVFDFHCFEFSSEQIRDIVTAFRAGTRADVVVTQFVKASDVAKIKRYEQGVVFNMRCMFMPRAAFFADNEVDFHQQQYCLYEIKVRAGGITHNYGYARYKSIIDVGALIPALHAAEITADNHTITWVPATLTRDDIRDPIAFVTNFNKKLAVASEAFQKRGKTLLAEMLVKIAKSNKKYPFFGAATTSTETLTAVVKAANYVTRDSGWYAALDSLLNAKYTDMYRQVIMAVPTRQMICDAVNVVRDHAFKPGMLTPMELQIQLAPILVRGHYKKLGISVQGYINIIHSLPETSSTGMHQLYADYLWWKERYLAKQALKTRLAYLQTVVRDGDVNTVVATLKTLAVNHLPALEAATTPDSKHMVLVAQVCTSGGFYATDEKGVSVFESCISDFPDVKHHPPRFRKHKRKYAHLPPTALVANINKKVGAKTTVLNVNEVHHLLSKIADRDVKTLGRGQQSVYEHKKGGVYGGMVTTRSDIPEGQTADRVPGGRNGIGARLVGLPNTWQDTLRTAELEHDVRKTMFLPGQPPVEAQDVIPKRRGTYTKAERFAPHVVETAEGDARGTKPRGQVEAMATALTQHELNRFHTTGAPGAVMHTDIPAVEIKVNTATQEALAGRHGIDAQRNAVTTELTRLLTEFGGNTALPLPGAFGKDGNEAGYDEVRHKALGLTRELQKKGYTPGAAHIIIGMDPYPTTGPPAQGLPLPDGTVYTNKHTRPKQIMSRGVRWGMKCKKCHSENIMTRDGERGQLITTCGDCHHTTHPPSRPVDEMD